MELGITCPDVARAGGAAETAERAENLGYESFWLGELWGENSFMQLAEAAMRTHKIRLATGIVNVYSRTPAVLAMGAHSLDRASDGRAALGVGVSSPKAVEDLHSLCFERPVRRTHEAVELIKEFLGGNGRVHYHGEIFQVDDFSALNADVPIANAALGPGNRRVTGRLCDAWMPNNVPLSIMADWYETITDSAREAGRDPEDIQCTPWIHTAVCSDPAVARDAIRGTVAYYVGAADGYKNAVGAAYPDEAEQIAATWRSGDRDAARESVTAEMVADLGCAGTAEQVRAQLREVAKKPFVDLPIVAIPDGLDDDRSEQTMTAVAPSQF
jgi:alkanesulfonate monooxygenase SsuD/methylene tetrahydromethanopterin reductase-like flavin-dependent oxidoreductase (luciferase family)